MPEHICPMMEGLPAPAGIRQGPGEGVEERTSQQRGVLGSVGITDGDTEAQRAGDPPRFQGADTSTAAQTPGHLCTPNFQKSLEGSGAARN